MRRAPIVLSTTAVGLVAVLSFRPREPSLPASKAAAPVARQSTATTAAASPPVTTTPSRAAASAAKTATGDAIATPYGNAQVRVSVKDGKITAVTALQLQGNDPKSVEISGSAEPLLRESALTKQTAAIDAVSGATFTSASYAASLQSALDKVGFRAADGSRGDLPGG